MKKLRVGDIVKVNEGSGLDSGRIGEVIPVLQNKLESGRYWQFNSKREVMIKDGNGNYFTMFKNRLIKVG